MGTTVRGACGSAFVMGPSRRRISEYFAAFPPYVRVSRTALAARRAAPARLWHPDRHAVAAGWIRGAAVACARRLPAGLPGVRLRARGARRRPVRPPVRRRRPDPADDRPGPGRPRSGTPGRPGGAGRCCWPTSAWWWPSCWPPRGWSAGRRSATGVPTLGVAWMAGPVLAWAVSGGRRRGTVAALLVAGADLATRERIGQSSFTGVILMLLAGVVVGHVARLAVTAEERLQRAVELEAATRERERLARDIHDSVLQVLALVQRRGADLRRGGRRAGPAGRRAGGGAAGADRRCRPGRRRPPGRRRGGGPADPARPVRLGGGGALRPGHPGAAARDGWPESWPPRPARRWTTWGGTPAGGPGC